MQKHCSSFQAQNVLLGFIFTGVFITILTFPSYSQLAPVNPPSGGFRIDGDLKAGTPSTNDGDWISGTSGGFVFNNDGTPVNGSNSRLIRDAYHTSGDDVFAGSSFSQNPNAWGKKS